MIDRYDPDLLLGYIEGDLGQEDRARIEEMMAKDPQLAGLIQGLESDRSLLRSIPEEQAPAGMVDDALHQLERTMLLDSDAQDDMPPIPIQRGRELGTKPSTNSWGRVLGISGLAAAILIGAGVTYIALEGDPLNRTAWNLAADNQPADETGDEDAPSPAPPTPEDLINAELEAGEAAGAASIAELRATDSEGIQPGAVSARGFEEAVPAAPRAGANEQPKSTGQPLLDRVTDAILAGPLASGSNTPANPSANSTTPARPDSAFDADANPQAQLSPVIALAENAGFINNPPPNFFVLSESPEKTREQIVQWCVDNGVPVVETEGLEFAYDTSIQTLGVQDDDQPAIPGNLALLIEPEQLSELNDFVNANQAQPTVYRQRAVINTAVAGDRQRAMIAQQRYAETTDLAQDSEPAEPKPANQYTQIKVPNDLGDDVQTRRNADNTLDYNNRLAIQNKSSATYQAPAASREPATLSEQPSYKREANDAAPDVDSESTKPLEGVNEPGVEAEDSPAPDGERSDAEPSADQPDQEFRRDISVSRNHKQNDETGPTSDPRLSTQERGNWLLPQLPLVNPTPIWPVTPETQLVPLVLRQGSPQELAPDLSAELEKAKEAPAESQAGEPGEAEQPSDASEPEPPTPAQPE